MSERECDRAAARIAPLATTAHYRTNGNRAISVGEGLAPPATTAHYCTNGKPEKRDEQARPLQMNVHRKTSPRGHPERLREARRATRQRRVGSRGAVCLRKPVSFFGVCAFGTVHLPEEKLLVIVRRSRRHSALLHSSVLLRSHRFVVSRLRKTSRTSCAQDDTLEFLFCAYLY